MRIKPVFLLIIALIFFPVVSSGEQQQETVKTLIEQLNSDDRPLQEQAAKKLAELKDENSVNDLVITMQGGNNLARRYAAWALSQILDPRTIDTLRDTLADEDKNVASLAKTALVKFGPQATESLKEGLKSDVWDIRFTCAQILGSQGDRSGVDILFEAVKAGSKDSMMEALKTLSALNEKKALDPLIDLLTHIDEKTRKKSLETLSRWVRSHPSIIPDVLNSIRTTSDTEMKLQLISSLMKIDNPSVYNEMVHLTEDREASIRLASIQALSQLKKPESIPVFVKALHDKDSNIRLHAAVALSRMEAKEGMEPLVQFLKESKVTSPLIIDSLSRYGKNAIPKVLPLLKDENKTVRRSAVQVLGVIGSSDSLNYVLNALKDSSPEVRAAAAGALRRIHDERSIPNLVDALNDTDPKVKQEATYALVTMDNKTIAFLNKMWKTGTPADRQKALYILGKMGTKDALSLLKAALRDKDVAVRINAAQALSDFGEDGFDLLTSFLNDPDRKVRQAAIESLGKIRDPRAVKPLLKFMNTDLKNDAVLALSKISSEEALPALLELLKDRDGTTRTLAAEAIGDIGDKKATSKLIPLLSDKDIFVRLAAVEALGKLGDHAATEPLLKILTTEGDMHLRRSAAKSLGYLAGQESIKPLLQVLRVEDDTLRINALISLNFILQRTKAKVELTGEEIKTLLGLLESPNDSIRIQALDALNKFGTQELVDPLMEQARSGENISRILAISALGTIGAEKAAPMLIEFIKKEPGEDIQRAAMTAVGKLKDPAAVTPLIKKLKSDDPQIRATAATALGKIGDEKAVPALTRLLGDDNEQVRKKAGEALEKITGEECPILVALSPFVPYYPYLFIFMVAVTVIPTLRRRIKPFDRGISSIFSVFSFLKKDKVQWWLAFIVGIGALLFFIYCTFVEVTSTSIEKGGDDFYSNLALFTIRVFPFFVGGCLVSGLIMKYFATRNILPRSMVGAFTLGGLIPLCSCGAVPVTRAMLTVNVPKRAVIAFLIVAPVLNPFVMVMSYGVIGVEYLILRIVAVFLLAVGSGLLIERLVPTEEMDEGTPICQLCKSCTSPGATGAASSGLIAGWNLMIYLLPYIFFGLITGALIATFIPVVVISKYLASDILGLFLAVTIGIPIFLCSGEEIVMLKPLLDMGLPMGHAIAFTLAANGICVSSIAVLFGVLGKKTTVYLTLSFWVGSFFLGYVINIFF